MNFIVKIINCHAGYNSDLTLQVNLIPVNINLMKTSFDQTTDYSHKELYQYLKGVAIPEFVKSANLDVLSDINDLAKEAFASPEYRAFPINTPAQVFVSNAFFINKKAELERYWGRNHMKKVEANIKSAAEIFEVEKECKAYDQFVESRENQKVAENKYVFVTKIGDDEAHMFPYRDAWSLQKAAEHFVKTLPNYKFEWRRDIASNFVKLAKELGVEEVPDIICKYAGMYYPNSVDVEREMTYRMSKLDLTGIAKQAYIDVVNDIKNIGEKEEFFKLAECVHYLEKMAGLHSDPTKKSILRDPVDAIFSLSVEKTAELLDVVDMAGEKYQLGDLMQIPAEKYAEACGLEIDPSNENSLRDILPTLPRSDVAMLRDLTGVRPVA